MQLVEGDQVLLILCFGKDWHTHIPVRQHSLHENLQIRIIKIK
jgi:hypothetical protein